MRFSRVLLAVALLATVSGCARVDLTNEWPGLAEPTGWEPKPGACSLRVSYMTYRDGYEAVDCTKTHAYETVYIGQFTGDAAASSSPPGQDDAAHNAAWAECDAKATEFLGGQWRGARLFITVSVPSPGNWGGGARWFRCELSAQEPGASRRQATGLQKTLKGELAGDSPLRLGCFDIPKEDNERIKPVDCGTSHNGEYIGVFPLIGDWKDVESGKDTLNHAKCLSLIAAYAGVPDDRNMFYRTGTYLFQPADWEAGDRLIRCYMWQNLKPRVGSIKGAGTKGFPLH